ncbi:hypothetical protein AEAC466_05210 [Asticcacaulis sp. AC466]|uniref:hypothetical protein n=1 Tax=Asticcacaulis sp. AC466 TaxID=1282362 RepID=UPI0003C3F513|nr:hypothetical protein [Asticcacaulis sp. AC466]ESQ85110.1 hypothetical protein AEAC466_05210 [Asticcacaulis sp. AC466]
MNIRIFASRMAMVAAVSMAVSTYSASAKEDAHLWEIKVSKTAGESEPVVSDNWRCMADSGWANPPAVLTGAQCPDQTFTRERDVLSWSVDCDAAKGQGQWTFSRGDRAVEGKSTIVSDGVTIVTAIDGKTSDKCTL